MKDQSLSRSENQIESLGMQMAPLTIEVPTSRLELSLQFPNRLPTRQPRRKRRTRPAAERFHGKTQLLSATLADNLNILMECGKISVKRYSFQNDVSRSIFVVVHLGFRCFITMLYGLVRKLICTLSKY